MTHPREEEYLLPGFIVDHKERIKNYLMKKQKDRRALKIETISGE